MDQKKEEEIIHTWDNPEEEEEWLVVMSNKSEYELSKSQAWALRQEIASGNRGVIMFQTFSISIPYILEFYRVKKYLKNLITLPERLQEEPYQPIPDDRWNEIKKNIYKKIGR